MWHMWQSQEKSSKVRVWFTSEYKGSEDNMWAGEFSKRWTDKKLSKLMRKTESAVKITRWT